MGTGAMQRYNFRRPRQRTDKETSPKTDEQQQPAIETCAICLGGLSKNLKTLHCSHTFHKACIQTWLKRSVVCPLCRQPDGDTAKQHSELREYSREEHQVGDEEDFRPTWITPRSTSPWGYPGY